MMELMQKFTTAGVSPDRRLLYWNEITEEVFTGTYVNADADKFAGEMFHWNMGGLNMIRTRARRSGVGRCAKDLDEEHMILHLQCRGTSLYRQGSYEERLEPGDFSIGSSHKPYSFDLSEHELLVIEFPKQPLADRLPGLDDLVSRRISGASPSGRMFFDFMLSLWRQAGNMPQEPDWSAGMTNIFYDMTALAVKGAEGTGGSQHGHLLRRRALALIESRLGDADLRTSSIAQELGLSVRTVQNLFATMNTTPMGYVLDRRLDRAAERLMADPAATVTEVAFDHGFSDAGYFTRCFRQKFGAPPREWRMGR